MMLQRAQQCRTRLQAYCSNWRPEKGSTSIDDDNCYDLQEDVLSPEEWEGVDEVIKVLTPLLHYTKLAERRDVGLQDWVPIVDKLTSHFYEASQRFKSMADEGPIYEWLHICCEKAWEKLNDYYQLADQSPVYYTAMVMDASLKYEWFEQKWNKPPKRNWIPGVKATVTNHWKQSQKASAKQSTLQQAPPQRQKEDEFDEDDYKRISYTSAKPQANAFAQYCAEDAIEGFKLSDWKTMEKKQPYLVQFALDHALPISISDCERSFSSAKFTLNPLRACMKSDLFEALETLRAWYLQKQQDNDRNNEEMGWKEELEVISKALEGRDIDSDAEL
jgi:hAT family protein